MFIAILLTVGGLLALGGLGFFILGFFARKNKMTSSDDVYLE